MTTTLRLEELRPAAEHCLAEARMTGLVLAVAQGDGSAQTLALGVDATDVPLADGSLFICASITKLATALAVLRLVDEGDIDLDAELARYLPDAAAARPGVTLRRILSHSAGLPVDVHPDDAPYQLGLTWATLGAACLRKSPAVAPDKVVQYGNLGYGLAAVVVERLTGMAFAEALRALVLEPLGIEGYLGDEPPRPPAKLADVRSNDPPELEPFNSPFYRSLAMPWSGLVTTAVGALTLVRAFAGYPTDFLFPTLVADARSNQTHGLPGGSTPPLRWPDCPWGVGPEIRGAKRPHWSPPNAAADAFGHAGASGCIAWHDPQTTISYAIMGTRTADNGWLVRHASKLGGVVVES